MAYRRLTDAEVLAQVPAATRRAARARRTEPHGRAVRYLRHSRQLVVDLINGTQLRVPIECIPGLVGASGAALSQVELSPAGVGLAWDVLDVDCTVMQLAILAFGPKTVARAAAAAAGATRSPAKAAAARRNGKKGGRPRKSVVA